MGRPPCCDKIGIKKGPWTPEEDIILVSYIQEHGPGNWRSVPTSTGLMRCSKSCRLRWTNYLRPGIKRGNFTQQEEGMIIHLQTLLGNKWAAIASYLPQRTDNDIKNYWNTHLKKKLNKLRDNSSDHHQNNCMVAPTTQSHAPQPYASSTENISKLLEAWTKPPATTSSTTTTTTATTNGKQDGRNSGNFSNGDVLDGGNDFEALLSSFEAMNGGGVVTWSDHHHYHHHIKYPPSSPPVGIGAEQLGGGHGESSATATALQPPFSALEKWIFDDSVERAEGLMDFSAAGRCSNPVLNFLA